MRLQVFLSRNGVCSRRNAFDLVQNGSVSVNGRRILEPSFVVDPAIDKISVDGRVVDVKSYEYILLNKPQGYVTTNFDPHVEKTVYECLPQKFQHLSFVGRLDQDTEGLLLFTNDGDLTQKLTHPSFLVDKRYFVRVVGVLTKEKQTTIETGVVFEGQKTSPAKIENVKIFEGQTECFITIHEGRKRQVRFMFGELDLKVVYLKRVAQGPLVLGDLKVGEWRSLSDGEVKLLKNNK